MLLKQCHVQGFGKLQEFTYEFSEGFNVICTENGWGKSTLAAFLRAMFYGLPQAGSRTKLDDAERRKYRPWNGGIMGGSLVFEVDGKMYRAERTFGKKEAEDTFRLLDLSTNLESDDYSAELGKELFGLDKEAYSRSTYLPQNKISDGGMNDSIAKKLGRMAEGEDDSGNYDKAYETLEELRKKYIPDRQKDEKGYVAELTRKLSEAQMRLDGCRRKEESAKPWREKEQNATLYRKQLETELVSCREKLETAAGYEALAAKKKHYTELREREEELRVKKESLQRLFPTGVPELSELRLCRQEAQDAAALAGEIRSYRMEPEEQRRLSAFHEMFAKGVPEQEEIQQCIRLESEAKEQLRQTELLYQDTLEIVEKSKKTSKRCLLFAVILLCLSIIMGVSAFALNVRTKENAVVTEQEEKQPEKNSAGVIACASFGGVTILGAIYFCIKGLQSKSQGKVQEQQRMLYEEELLSAREQGNSAKELLERCGIREYRDVTEAFYHLLDSVREYESLSEKENNFHRCMAQKETLLSRCTELLMNYGMDTEDVAGNLHILENRTKDFNHFSEEFAEAEKKREQFEQETAPETFYGLSEPEESFRELQAKEQVLLLKIAQVTEEEKDCRDRAERFEEEAEECTELEELCAELSASLEQKKREHFYVTETLKCLKTAKEQFSSRYLRGLTTGFDKYISLLGEEDFSKSMTGHYDGVSTDINLNVQVTAYGEGKELGYFSTGMRDLVGLCMRFALIDALFSEETPFLVLDDPFVNLDKEKMARAVSFLKEAGEKYQILYLVCHESRA